MFSRINASFWAGWAYAIIRFRYIFLAFVGVVTLFFIYQWRNVQFTFKEANMLSKQHPINLQYQQFLNTFGEEGNLIMLGVSDPNLFTAKTLTHWNDLNKKLQSFSEISHVISTHNLSTLIKDTTQGVFRIQNIPSEITSDSQAIAFKNKLFDSLPFYDGLIYNKSSQAIFSGIYLKEDIVNTKLRKDFILQKLLPTVQMFEKQNHIRVHMSGMPYIRTLSTQSITNEMILFIVGALLITCLTFFFFFRSFRAMIIAMSVVIIGVIWAFGSIGFSGYKITILTAVIPPLIIVIGIPNCIFLINKYQHEIQKYGRKDIALQRVIRNIGQVTLLTNLTTATGFATFIFTESSLLKEFGVIASINIICVFLLSIILIPIIYSFLNTPKERHLKHLKKLWIKRLIHIIQGVVSYQRKWVYLFSLIILLLCCIGISKIRISGSLIEDLPQNTDYFNDIRYFENELGGIVPLEITIDTQRKNGVIQHSTIQKIDTLEQFLKTLPNISKPLSITQIAKLSKQAFYNDNPKKYSLPSKQEQQFILPYFKGFSSNKSPIEHYIDKNKQTARITTFIKDINVEQMQSLEDTIQSKAKTLFSSSAKVYLTGSAYMFSKGTPYLVSNLLISLSIAIMIISFLMAYMFRSFKMILIALVPNLLPLLTTATMMGFLNIPLKPSTILVFSIAFGISVDDTIHFLAKYKQELRKNKRRNVTAILRSLSETGISMFYTSIVLFLGFSVFSLSSFGGTKALGGLVSTTLLVAMATNLILLPSLLISFNKKKNKSF